VHVNRGEPRAIECGSHFDLAVDALFSKNRHERSRLDLHM
jgi:hypothetical protein